MTEQVSLDEDGKKARRVDRGVVVSNDDGPIQTSIFLSEDQYKAIGGLFE